MSKIGCEHAAKMHAYVLEHGTILDFTKQDWLTHIEEEEKYWIPYAKEISMWKANIILAQHKIFLRELAIFGKIISVDLMKKHAKMEDEISELIAKKHPYLLEGL